MRIWVATVLMVCVGTTAQALEIPVTVEEPAGVARVAEPVSGGIPLPAGQFKKDQPFALFDGEKEVPVQVLPLVVDEKGFLRWILLDFQTDLAASEKKTFTLKTADGSVRPAKAVRVTRNGTSVTVNTGAASFTVDAGRPFALFSQAGSGGKPVVAGGEVSYVDGFSGKRYAADKPASIDVEYEGPMRATVCIKGGFVGDDDNKFQYIARITAWAGKTDVHVKYSLSNSNPDHYTYRRVKDSTVTLNLAGPSAGATLGASKPIAVTGDAWIQQSMRVVPAAIHSHDMLGGSPWFRQTPGASEPGGGKAVSAGNDLWTSQGKGDVAEGWIAAKTAAGTLWVSDLYFVEDPPRRLALTKGALALTGVTEPLEGTKPPFGEKVRWLFDCSHLSSQYVFDFAAPGETAALSAKAKRARARLWAMAPPAWYFETEALAVGRFGTQADELACYDRWAWTYEKADAPTGPAHQTARIRRWVAGDDNHFTSEQDTLEALILMYIRTGRRTFFDAAEAWGNYFTDLQTWRTDGWRWRDGGVWWHGGPAGNRPQRPADPVTGLRNSLPAEWTKQIKTKIGVFDRMTCKTLNAQFLMKACYCHNWGEGLAAWFLLTGDRDVLEAAIDTVEQNIDTQRRAFRKVPGKTSGFSRDFTRACYLTNATRMVVPTDPFVVEASDYLARVYLERPNREPRGLVNPAGWSMYGILGGTLLKQGTDAERQKKFEGWLKGYVGEAGVAEMKRIGVKVDFKTGDLIDPTTGARWQPVVGPPTWMFPPLSRAMGTYCRITGSEDALDWTIAYGQAVARVLFQPKHGNLFYGRMLVDFPAKGVAKDWASWALPEGAKNGEGVKISGYLGRCHPDVAARAYSLCGEPFLKQRAHDFWYYSSHRGYNTTKMHNIGGVGRWVNTYTTHGESVCYTGRTFYEWSHPRTDEKPPKPVADVQATVEGKNATITFTAPADEGGGKVVRYQVKCSDKPIVDYETFLKKWADNEDAAVCNWWMAVNLKDEPAPAAAGTRERFVVTGVPEGATYFAVRAFDDSSNRSALSNVAEAGR